MRLTVALLTVLGAGVLPAQVTRVEENAPAVVYNGNWTPATDANASGGTYVTSSSGGSTVTFKFTGDTLTIYRCMDTTGGQADITIDGVARGTLRFDLYERRWAVPAVLDNLGAGDHTLVLTVNGQQPTLASGTTTFIDAFETPSAFVPTAAQTAGINTFNTMRQSIGLPPVRLSLPLTMAAQNHADYMSQNRFGAQENAGRTGFTGFFGPDRSVYTGYPTTPTAWEVLSRNSDPTAALGDWNASVYQRLWMVDYNSGEAGFGSSQLNNQNSGVLRVSTRFGKAPASRIIILCPTDNMTNVPLTYVEEPTDPLPGVPRPLGFPISLHITLPSPRTQGNDNVDTVGTLTDAGGNAVPVRFIWTQNDQKSQLRDRNHYYLVPLQPLQPNTKYTARIAGLDESFTKFDMTWSFTTTSTAATPPPPGSATFLATDTTTSGSWQGVYGTEGFTVIGDMNQPPAYGTVNTTGSFPFTWLQSTTDPRALQKPMVPSDRVSSCWYSATSFTVDLPFNDNNPHQVALYMLDWDRFGDGRTQTVEILDSTLKVLDTRQVSNFNNGVYLVWNLSGKVTVRITNTNPNSNAVLTGIFFK